MNASHSYPYDGFMTVINTLHIFSLKTFILFFIMYIVELPISNRTTICVQGDCCIIATLAVYNKHSQEISGSNFPLTHHPLHQLRAASLSLVPLRGIKLLKITLDQ